MGRSAFNSVLAKCVAVTVVLVSVNLSIGTSLSPAQECSIEIRSPRQGDQIGRQGMVRGKAAIPEDAYLWVLVHIIGLRGWWPQGGGSAELIDDEWEVLAFYGQARDVGNDFDIAVAVVDTDTNSRLEKWVENGNPWPPIPFPNTVSGCAPVRFRVVKTSH